MCTINDRSSLSGRTDILDARDLDKNDHGLVLRIPFKS